MSGVFAAEHGNLQPLFNLEQIEKAYQACRRRKRGTINALRFESKLLDNLCDLRDELQNRTYHPSSSICFVQKRPKLREIFAADFRDRVVHHLLVGYLEPIFEKIFIHDSFACRTGKGVHAGVGRLHSFLNRVTQNGTQRAWYVKMDVAGFFMNVDKAVLLRLLEKKIKRPDVRWLIRTVLEHDCTQDYHFKGPPGLLEKIPSHKTLFKVDSGKGLPIGNLTSQFFANVYLNELDQFVKRQLKCRYYIRYCDDFLLLHASREQLADWRKAIETFLREKLLLNLNTSQDRLAPVANGIDFLGYVVRRRYILVRQRVVNHFQEKLRFFEDRLSEKPAGWKKTRTQSTSSTSKSARVRPAESGPSRIRAWRYPPACMARFRATTASYLGHFNWANSARLTRSLFSQYKVLQAAFLLQDGKIKPRYLPGTSTKGLRASYLWWLPECRPVFSPQPVAACSPLWTQGGVETQVLVFFRVGRFYEFYGAQAELAQSVLGLQEVVGLRGFLHGCGFHRRWLSRYLVKAREQGFHVALIHENKDLSGMIQRRLVKVFRAFGRKEVV